MSTTERALTLLALLQARPTWSGTELAERLGVTTRSVRRDVERLRALGYPVEAERGAAGGYRLGAGRALPPLLLADDEAVAVAVSLRLAAGGVVAGTGEAALRTLAKLDQVMPPRLRGQVHAISEATDTLPGVGPVVDGAVLLTLARACRDRHRTRFTHVGRDGTTTERHVEPVRLVASSRRWYLLAHDLERDDWRTFRLDRVDDVRVGTWVFATREHPDPLGHVQRSVSSAPYRHEARVRVLAPAAVVAEQVAAHVGRVEAESATACVLTAGADDVAQLVPWLVSLGHDLEVLEPPALVDAVAAAAARLGRAGGRRVRDAGSRAARCGRGRRACP